jgi:hypothetical protein
MIPKMAIDQARVTHRNSMARIWYSYLAAADAAWRFLESAYSNARKTLNSAMKAAEKSRKSKHDDAWRNHKRALRTSEGAPFRTYEETKLSIDSEFEQEREHAKEVYEKAVAAAEDEFKKQMATINEKYKDDTATCVDNFLEAHP